MKKLLVGLIAVVIVLGLAIGFIGLDLTKTAGPPGMPSLWKLVSGVLSPVNSSWSVAIGTTGVSADRGVTKLSLTADTVLTAAQILANGWISNQGDDGEQDDTLPAVSYPIAVTFLVEEAQIIEVNPPSDELFDFDGTDLDANDCIDSPAIVGSKMVCTRIQIASGAWRWSCDTVRGVWADTGATD